MQERGWGAGEAGGTRSAAALPGRARGGAVRAQGGARIAKARLKDSVHGERGSLDS